jgi:hypothetical protein
MEGRDVCYHHGGKSKRGAEHPNYQAKGYSEVIPKRLLETYDEVLDNTKRNELVHEIALVEARVRELVGRVDTGESGAIWRELRGLASQFRSAARRGDEETTNDLLDQILRTIGRGHSDERAWDDVDRWVKSKTKLVESDRRRAVEDAEMIHNAEALAIVAEWTAITRQVVEEVVHDTAKADKILGLVSARIGGGPSSDGSSRILDLSPN